MEANMKENNMKKYKDKDKDKDKDNDNIPILHN